VKNFAAKISLLLSCEAADEMSTWNVTQGITLLICVCGCHVNLKENKPPCVLSWVWPGQG